MASPWPCAHECVAYSKAPDLGYCPSRMSTSRALPSRGNPPGRGASAAGPRPSIAWSAPGWRGSSAAHLPRRSLKSAALSHSLRSAAPEGRKPEILKQLMCSLRSCAGCALARLQATKGCVTMRRNEKARGPRQREGEGSDLEHLRLRHRAAQRRGKEIIKRHEAVRPHSQTVLVCAVSEDSAEVFRDPNRL